MSQADNLLNALIAGDAKTEGHIVVDSDRYITVPEELKRIAVQWDKDVETVTFDCPRYWDGVDLSVMRIYVNYKRPDNEVGAYLCDNVMVDDTDSSIIHFDWTISNHVSAVDGRLFFLVCAKSVDEEGNEHRHWNSELNMDMRISGGLEVAETIINAHPDIITQLLERMDSVEGTQSVITGEQIIQLQNQIVSNYAEFTMFKLTNSQTIATLEDVDDELKSSIDDLKAEQETQNKNIQSLTDADNLLDARIDSLETILTGAETAIAHSLTAKGVAVPDDMSIQDVAGLIDTIEMDIPTALQSITITTPPNQNEYYQGETFNPEGMVVTADFGDGVTVPVENYTVSPTVMTEGMTEVVVSLTVNGVTKTATCPIRVTSVLANTMPIGSLITIAESDVSNTQYRLVDTDYLGNMLLVREELLDETVKYHNSTPSYSSDNTYIGSNLDTYLNETFYGSLPSSTAAIIQPVDIPIGASAHVDAEQVYLNRYVFTLSAKEWGLNTSSLEGETIEYLDNLITGSTYWTRQPSSGYSNNAYQIKADGKCNSVTVTTANGVRPAFCISKNQPVKETDDGWIIAGSTSSAAYMSVDDEGNATIHGVTTFTVDADGNATITV